MNNQCGTVRRDCVCVLPVGHLGWHEDEDGRPFWNGSLDETDAEPPDEDERAAKGGSDG